MISSTGKCETVSGANFSESFSGRRWIKGFTLLELIVVMALIGSVLALAAPTLRGFLSAREVENAASHILTLTRFASSRAASEGRIFRLHIDTQENSYWLEMQVGEDYEKLADAFGETWKLPPAVAIERIEPSDIESKGYIAFEPTGKVDTADIFLRGRRDELISISCESPTERFRIVVVE